MFKKYFLLVFLPMLIITKQAIAVDIDTTCRVPVCKFPPCPKSTWNSPICFTNKSGVVQTITTADMKGLNYDDNANNPNNLNNLLLAPEQRICKNEAVLQNCKGATFNLTLTNPSGQKLEVVVGKTPYYNAWFISNYISGQETSIRDIPSDQYDEFAIYPY